MRKWIICIAALLALSIVTVSALDETLPLRVVYYGTETTLEALEAEGLEPHCVTENTTDLQERGVFDFSLDRAVCFDTIAEADEYLYEAYPELRGRVDAPSNSVFAEPQFVNYTNDYFSMFAHIGYSGYTGDITSNRPTYTTQLCSVWRTGTPAMRLYKGTNYNGVSWTITGAHWSLGSWCGNVTKSIKFF